MAVFIIFKSTFLCEIIFAMYKFLTKNGQTIAFGIGTLITVIFLIIVFAGASEFSALPIEEQRETGIFNFGLVSSIALVILTVIALLAFGIAEIFSNFKASAKGLIGFGILLLVFIIAFSTASGEPTPYIKGAIEKWMETGSEITPGNLKFISGGITTALVMVVAAVVAFVFSEVRNFFK